MRGEGRVQGYTCATEPTWPGHGGLKCPFCLSKEHTLLRMPHATTAFHTAGEHLGIPVTSLPRADMCPCKEKRGSTVLKGLWSWTSADPRQQLSITDQPAPRAVLKGPDFFCFFLLRTALKDRPKGPPTANRHQPPTTNRQPPTASHQPPTTNRHQPPATNRRQPPAATNRQLPTTANRHQPPITNHQPPPTTTNCHQLPVANCQPPTATNCQPPTATNHG